MRDHSKHIQLSRFDAVDKILSALEQDTFANNPPIERASLDESYGCVLAQDITTKTNLPNTLTCCMDSIAVHWDAFENLAEGEVPDVSTWVQGVDWEFANTGVAMPEGFDTAIVIEHATLDDSEKLVAIEAAPSAKYAGTKAAGSNMKIGDVVAKAGCVITPDIAATIASAGYSSVDVIRRPRVAFIPTGNELVPPNIPFSEESRISYAGLGKTFESNSLVVKGKIEAWGGTFVPFDIVPDEYESIKNALLHACDVADIIVLNAGSSKGSDDWSVEVMEEIGEIICHQTNHGPGHHSSYAVLKHGERPVPVVGISGPPGGASFTLNFYLRPIMKAYLGQDPTAPLIPAKLNGSFGENKFAKKNVSKMLSGESRPPETKNDDEAFFSVKFMELTVSDNGELLATPIQGKAGSAKTVHANAMYMLAAGPSDTFPEPGSIIYVELR